MSDAASAGATARPDAKVVSFCARAGLIADGESPRFTPLTGGVASDIWLVETRQRSFCVKQALSRLRVAAEWRAPTERNIYEARWLRAAAAVAPDAVPRVLAEDSREAMFAMSYLPAERYPRWKDQLMEGRVDAGVAQSVGATLVRLHAAFAADAEMPERFGTGAIFEQIRIEPYLRATAERHPRLRPRLEALAERTLGTARSLVHGDISPKNILVGPSGPVFVDAECAWYGDPAFDLAFCLNHLLLKCLAARHRRARLLESFSALAGAYLAGVDWEPPAEFEARAASLLPALFLARVDGKSPVEYLAHESDKAAVREVAGMLLAAPLDRLAGVRDAWRSRLEAMDAS